MERDAAAKAAASKKAADSWKCACGAENTGKFCAECGAKRPAPAAGWICPSCGAKNTGKFCSECGAKAPAADEAWVCPDCGTKNTGKFCSGCGKQKG